MLIRVTQKGPSTLRGQEFDAITEKIKGVTFLRVTFADSHWRLLPHQYEIVRTPEQKAYLHPYRERSRIKKRDAKRAERNG